MEYCREKEGGGARGVFKRVRDNCDARDIDRKKKKEKIGKLNKGYIWLAKAAREKKEGKAKGGVLVDTRKRIKFHEAIDWKYEMKVTRVKVDKRNK